MLANAFIGKARKPTDKELESVLGVEKSLWDRLLSQLVEECKLSTREWNSYSRKAGWSLRVKHGDRNILYLSPHAKCFTASFALGDRAVKAALESTLPEHVTKLIREAKRYAEGTAVRIEVKTVGDLTAVKKLANIKLEN